MVYALLAAAVLLAGLVWWSRRDRPSQGFSDDTTPSTARHEAPVREASPPVVALPEPGPLPAVLEGLDWPTADSLTPQQRWALLERLRQIPRPPRAFQQLVSPDFVARATSGELSELVLGEPTIAAKVLATVNSPLYGLKKTVTSIGQGITFLGLNTVRSLCLRHMLDDATQAANAEVRQELDLVWTSLTLSSELAGKLAPTLRLADPGGLVTEVVLSHLGRIVALRLLPVDIIQATWHQGLPFAERTRASVEVLGAAPAEVAGLLMREWELPEAVVAAVAQVDRVLITSPQGQDAGQHARAVVAYLCARLGERLATGQLASLADFDIADTGDTDLHHVRTALPLLPRLPEVLGDAGLIEAMDHLVAGLKAPVAETQA